MGTIEKENSVNSAFYSQLTKAVGNAPARMSGLAGDQWAAWLAGNAAKLGVKQAEIEWSGVKDWLALQSGKVSKEGVLAYLDGNGLPLFQDSRGVFDSSTLTVTLLEAADESTFIHEAGHFYLEVLTDLAGLPGAPMAITEDVEAVMDWLGVPGGLGGWNAFSMEEKRPFHEQFARGVEAYFMTGVAPVPELDGMFSRFAKFLAGVYKSVVGLDVTLTPEVTKVFDRLVVGSSVEDRAGVDDVAGCLEAQLAALDRFPVDLNKAYAGMVANFYGAVAGAAGLSVVDLASKYPLEIRNDGHGLVPGGVEKTRTGSAEFKEWFGDSKVVGVDGGPLVVHHGTAVDFEAFDLNRVGGYSTRIRWVSFSPVKLLQQANTRSSRRLAETLIGLMAQM